MKTIFNKFSKTYECEKAKYINIRHSTTVLLKGNRYTQINKIKSSVFYKIFIEKKFLRPITENYWSELFDTPRYLWASIYHVKISKMSDKHIAEFNYKLFHRLLNNNLSVSKWNPNVQKFCAYCGDIENIIQLLFN